MEGHIGHVGMPGVGDSLGQCAVCEKTFLRSLLIGGDCKPFAIGCIEQTMYAHNDCADLLINSMTDGQLDPTKLPDSELKKLLLKVIEDKD